MIALTNDPAEPKKGEVFDFENAEGFVLCNTYIGDAPTKTGETLDLECNHETETGDIQGRYLYLFLTRMGRLSLCEVRAYVEAITTTTTPAPTGNLNIY